MAANVNRVKGAVGYVEYAYVKKNNMNFMQLQNADGKYVSPDDKTFAAAAAGADWFSVPGMGISMVNAKGAESWPISTASFILMYKEPTDKAQSAEVLKFFDWAFKNGKQMAADLDYVALPDDLTNAIRTKVWSQIAEVSSVFKGFTGHGWTGHTGCPAQCAKKHRASSMSYSPTACSHGSSYESGKHHDCADLAR